MSPVRTVASALLSALCSFGVVSAVSCGSDAVGIEDCRKIEEARCEAAAHCEGDIHVKDVDACKRYYRDHCLHGLAVDDDPGAPAPKGCLKAIKTAGHCAANDPNMTFADCAAIPGDGLHEQTRPELVHACDVIQFPEFTFECEFLRAPEPPPEQPVEGSAGQTGAAGAAAGGAPG